MDRLYIINSICKLINAQKYLEIGVFTGYTFTNNICPYKIGVDPDSSSKANVVSTSDYFFVNNTEKFDVIFIDGLHYHQQVKKDILNALNYLNDGGYIICHDMNPCEEIIQKVPPETGIWTGDCWKAWVDIRSERNDLDMFVVDTDYGCGIIKRGNQKLINVSCDLTYENFVKNKQEWMNIKSVQEFIQYLGAN
jgi:hypothetical protein